MKTTFITFFILGMYAYTLIPKDADLTGKLPNITSYTMLDAAYLEGGWNCFQYTTVIPDKFKADTRMECSK